MGAEPAELGACGMKEGMGLGFDVKFVIVRLNTEYK